ncbi:hypothetical protein CHUAL_009367 [Chamberlinius hualienensis]
MARASAVPLALLLWNTFVQLWVVVGSPLPLAVPVSYNASNVLDALSRTYQPLSNKHITNLHVIVLLDDHNKQTFLKVLQKAINEVNSDYGVGGGSGKSGATGGGGQSPLTKPKQSVEPGFQLVAIPLIVEGHSPVAIQQLCTALEQGNVTAILSVANEGATLAAVTVGGYAELPVMGIAPGYSDQTYKDLSRYFQTLNPTLDNLAEALSTFLLGNSWLSSTFITDDSLTSKTLCQKLINRTQTAHPHSVIVPINLPQSANASTIFEVLGDTIKFRSRVIVLHCETVLARRIFRQARRLNMDTGEWIWIITGDAMNEDEGEHLVDYPIGVLGMRVRPPLMTKHVVRMSVRILGRALHRVWFNLQRHHVAAATQSSKDLPSCRFSPSKTLQSYSNQLYREIQQIATEVINGSYNDTRENDRAEVSLRATIDLLNLIPEGDSSDYNNGWPLKRWRPLGNVTAGRVSMEAVIWPGSKLTGPSPFASGLWRVVTVHSPPFVMTSEALANHTCLVGVACLKVSTNNKEELSAISADFEAKRHEGSAYKVTCCYGYVIDLLENVAKELRINYVLYLVADGRFGTMKMDHWNGVMGDIVSGAAQLAFAPISVTELRSRYVGFSVPYHFSGVSFLTSMKFRDVPLLAFLAPFSTALWIVIVTSLIVTAAVAAAYEWSSPFGLNPWGRQRTKNFSLGSAFWMTWSLLFSHLVAFKAPKSWPNKVLINVWGCFSVIFLASYTANIAALFAGLFFQTSVNDFQDKSLLTQRVGTAVGTVAEYYVSISNKELWDHMKKYSVASNEEGVQKLRDGELDLIVGDTPLLDFYRGKEPGCTLRAVGHVIKEDSYAIATTKGSPLRDPISSLIAKYHENGYLDYLAARWYHALPCMRTSSEMYRPMRLSISAVAGVFITLCFGVGISCCVLILEHVVYKYILPRLRKKPKGTLWRSPNIMFFSQKLYRFINCVDLVSPHHSAKELVNNLRTGQITSLFQKSIKRKEHEQRRRRKSKAQFFEMIQEIRRVQKESKGSFLSRIGGSTAVTDSTNETFTIRRRSPAMLSIKFESELPNPPSQFGTFRDRGEPAMPPNLSTLPYYTDESCVQLIERVGKRSPSPSLSSSDDDSEFGLSAISASLNELSTIDDETVSRGRKKRRTKVRSVEDLTHPSSTRHRHHSKERHVHFSQPYPSSSSSQTTCRHHQEMPLTKFDFFDLPLKLNDARLKKLSKEDIVFMWQTSERDLRKRLQQALRDKSELERKIRQIDVEPP